ncbi:MAG TPA: hypothetical protein VNA28_05970 [Solirubrobacteraceae bacterium]|nr:hypothetical protein [Solirubrobacteraceae bacterium]
MWREASRVEHVDHVVEHGVRVLEIADPGVRSGEPLHDVVQREIVDARSGTGA